MKIIPISRRKIKITLLVVLGLALVGAGGGWNLKQLIKRPQPVAPTSVTVTPGPSTTAPLTDGDNIQGSTSAKLNNPPLGPWEQLAPNNNFFVEYRLERERARGRQVEILREVMASSSGDESSRKTAHQEYLRISDNIAKETELENLLRAKGFADAAVFLDQQSVTVVLEPQGQIITDVDPDLVALVAKSSGVDVNSVTTILRPRQD